MQNLVIVESPAKAKTIEKFLGKDYKVLSSFGHIRDLSKKDFGVDIQNHFQPIYEISPDKKKVVADLKAASKLADTVWLASDEDREGEAIAWHLYEVLSLKDKNTKRIVFHEITKAAIENAIQTPREIDSNLVNAQQARRVLDRIVGFELSPVLWKKIKPSLSAGRVQSVAVRLIVEREREVQHFQSEAFYKLSVVFLLSDKENNLVEMKAELAEKIENKTAALALMEQLKSAVFTIEDISTKSVKRTPAPPFTTSTLQQEAARKLGFSVSQTMRVAQALYESGKITYMRTDSVHLSSLALNTTKAEIESMNGKDYVKIRQYQTKSKGAQEAHEAIRPTYMSEHKIDGTMPEKRLYDLIWKRTIASQMADAELEKTNITIGISSSDRKLMAGGEVVIFDGFLKVYENPDREEDENEAEKTLPPVQLQQVLLLDKAQAVERFTQKPPRYTEAMLVHKLEELGIGRPSTYAPIISTIQQRGYIEKANREGEKREYNVLEMDKSGRINDIAKLENTGVEKAKLFPTDIGMVVNDFLNESFPDIMDYNFTASVEKQFDMVAAGKKEWMSMMEKFYKTFHPEVDKAFAYSEQKVGARILGTDPKSGRVVSVRIGRFGPVVQIGTAEDEEKPLFASMKKTQSMETISFEEALELFKLPRKLGEYENATITIGTGRFGAYVRHDNQYVSIPKNMDPMQITLEESIQLIEEKREADRKKLIKTFAEDESIRVLNGRFGPYIAKDGVNYKLPKKLEAASLAYEDCLRIIEEAQGKESTSKKKTYSAKKAATGKASTKKTTERGKKS